MTAPSFFHEEETVKILERAALSAGTPLSLHYVERNQEGPKIAGWGHCTACDFINQMPEGKRACRQSRLGAAAMALRQQRPIPFICHIGFACIAAPVWPEEGFVLTFGPYCPAEESRSLESDALNGYIQLTGEEARRFPVSLEDIHIAPASALPAVVEWTIEALADLRAKQAAEQPVASESREEEEGITAPGSARPRIAAADREEYASTAIAAALAAGNGAQARELLRGVLAETRSRARVSIAVRRARLIAAVASVLESAERAGLNTGAIRDGFSEFVSDVQSARKDIDLLDRAMALLRRVPGVSAPPTGKNVELQSAEEPFYSALNHLIEASFSPKSTENENQDQDQDQYQYQEEIDSRRKPKMISLEKVAKKLGEKPSAISHRLERQFGMSFSDYVNRLRIERAKEMLRRTKLPATEIGKRTGFSDLSNFTKVFKRFAGMTPAAYRTQFRSKK